jgi:sugar transferase (PEP-CTERM/EpsH1 system associated)
VPSLIRVRPYHFIRELSRRHEITVLATSPRDEVENAAALRAYCRQVEVVPLRLLASLRSCGRAMLRGEPLQGAVARMPELRDRLAALLGRERFDLAHVEHFRAAYVADLLPPDLPTVFDSVDCISLLVERTLHSSHSFRQRLLSRIELGRTRRYEARILDRFDRVVVTSAEDAAELSRLAPRARVTVVPNGVDLDHFHPAGRAPASATLVFSGKMSYHANATAALYFAREIFPRVKAAHPTVRLRIVGSDPPPAIRALARDPAIEVTGRVASMREAICGAAVAICPVTVKVGIQNKVLEAMAMGIPVVVSRPGATGIAATPGRDFLVADAAADFAAQVGRLLADPALCDRIGSAGRRFVEVNHRWSTSATRLEEIYRDLLLKSDSSRRNEEGADPRVCPFVRLPPTVADGVPEGTTQLA